MRKITKYKLSYQNSFYDHEDIKDIKEISKKLIIVIYFILTFLSAGAFSQPTQQWINRYPEINGHIANSNNLVTNQSGDVYVTGEEYTSNHSWICTIKYSPSGLRQWVADFIGSDYGGRSASAIALDSDSNVYITGYSNNPVTNFDFCTIKYNSNGVQQWVRYYDAIGGIDQAQKIVVDNARNIYVSGFSLIGGGNAYVYATVKYSSDGRQIWIRTYGNGGVNTYVNGLVVDSNCNIYVTGENDDKAVTIKYDSSGNQLWQQTYSGVNGRTASESIALDNLNNVYITGWSSGIQTFSDYITIKYSVIGNQLWLRRFNLDSTYVNSNYTSNSLVIDTTHNVYITGIAGDATGQNPSKLCTVKYSSYGDMIWAKKDSENAEGGRIAIGLDNKNGLYIAGSTYKQTQHPSYTLLKYDTLGYLLWSEKYYLPGNDSYVFDMKIDKQNCIYLTGQSGASSCTIKYSQLVGVIKYSDEIPVLFKLYQNYPNPFNPSTKIKFEIPSISQSPNSAFGFEGISVQLLIYDIKGAKVSDLINEKLKPGIYEIYWIASNLPSGIYFYTLQTNYFRSTKKMILLK